MGIRRAVRPLFDSLYAGVRGSTALKEFHEFRYWRLQNKSESVMGNSWYQAYYTDYFGIPLEYYEGKRILDVGCGPRGSLEWATLAKERVGLDPLVPKYRELGIDEHAMAYVEAYSESIPFDDGHFDVVMTMNSLDHVVDPTATIREICRVTAPGGTILILVNLNREPTACEPHSFGMEILDLFEGCECVFSRRLESPDDLKSWQIDYDEEDPSARPFGLAARLVKQT